MCLLVEYLGCVQLYKIVHVLFDVVLEACVNPVETSLATGISWFMRGRADKGNGHLLVSLFPANRMSSTQTPMVNASPSEAI